MCLLATGDGDRFRTWWLPQWSVQCRGISEKGITKGYNVQRTIEYKRNVLKWPIFAHFKELVVAHIFQFINCHHLLKNEITHRISDFMGSHRRQDKWKSQWYNVNASKIKTRVNLISCHTCHMGAVFWPEVPYGAWVRGGSCFASAFSDA